VVQVDKTIHIANEASLSSVQASYAYAIKMTRRNLLLCFDAFGTLFSPQPSVAKQYAEIAQQCGLGGFSVAQVKTSFGKAISNQLRIHPNYGRASGMGPQKWWTNVCTSLTPHVFRATN
jgi:hypothetical protein